MSPRSTLTVYCDGASRKDGRGGWGFAVYKGDVEVYASCGGAYDVTNNKMEMKAAIETLKWASTYHPRPILTVITDSMYVIGGITEYLDTWLRTGWRTSTNKPVKNQDLWEELGHLDCDLQPIWQHVKGHTGVIGNERADVLAGEGIPAKKETT